MLEIQRIKLGIQRIKMKIQRIKLEIQKNHVGKSKKKVKISKIKGYLTINRASFPSNLIICSTDTFESKFAFIE